MQLFSWLVNETYLPRSYSVSWNYSVS